MTSTLQDLRDALAEEEHGLRAPDLGTLLEDGRRLRRRRTTGRAVGAVAAAALVVAGAAGVVRLDPSGSDGGDVAATTATREVVVERAAQARDAHVRIDTRVRRLVWVPLSTRAWSGTRPDGEQGSRELPRDDREWATLQWLDFTADLPAGARLDVTTSNEPSGGAAPGPPAGQERRACTNVYDSCRTIRVRGGVVAVERGPDHEGRQGLRASFTPDDPAESWVMADVTTPLGEASPYSREQLVELVTDPEMSLPVPLAREELPDPSGGSGG